MLNLKQYIVIGSLAILTLFGTACKFNKEKKLTSTSEKLKIATAYYEKGKYGKALMLLEDLVLVTRGMSEGEEVLRKLAYCNYHVKDYILAGYYFRKYIEYYPKGKYTEEAMYMGAYCYYLDAPKTSLDQSATYTALQAFETFITKYPKSDKIPECNKQMDELRHRLEKKSYDNAILYYNLGYYNAAVVSLKNSLQSYPDSKYKEDALFYILKSSFLYAEKSIISKQEERYRNVFSEYNKFIRKFPDSKYSNEAKRIKKAAEKGMQKAIENAPKIVSAQ